MLNYYRSIRFVSLVMGEEVLHIYLISADELEEL